MNLTTDELKNIIVLINRANITGQEATPTAILLQKLSGMVSSSPVTSSEDKPIESVEEKENKK